MKSKYSIGTDPEVFLRLGGKFISAAGLIPGTKDEPFKVDKGAIQVDGLAAEFNIDPANSPEEFDNNIELVLLQLKELLAKVDKKIQLVFIPFANFDPKYFADLPEDCKILGCDPDFTYQGKMSDARGDLQDRPFRTAAGHVHIGFTKDADPMSVGHFTDCKYISEHFWRDFYGVSRQHYSPPYFTNEENSRLAYYGAYGAFRPKTYGIELRQYSNLWVEYPRYRRGMFNYIVNSLAKIDKQ